MFSIDDTIVAIASARGPAARGIVRISGAQMLDCVAAVFTADEPDVCLPALRSARRVSGRIALRGLGSPLTAALYLWPTARSFTRQPIAEIHTVGAPPLLDAIVAALAEQGARPAGPGEFTLRAFLAGRIDLTQAEAVLGVIDATGERDLQVALTQLAGGVGGALQRLRDALADLLAELEAGL
ncbi:MAG TPA: tRNA uridine-5-carboxymethylaminomethyl(34) synthesis GTPase MnmE, partial [Pirellulales bacterium]|nr:tRNA uridine-5-carboxymethylaminomethyl(34) synthesis GTPase MnmE [Pirellulales bacterium]